MHATVVIPQVSEDGRRLATVLQGVAVDTVIPYQELSLTIGRDVQTDARSAMDSARRQLQREHAMVFAPVKGVGLKRLSDHAIVATSQSTMKHIHRTARRGVRRLACVQDFAGLSNEERIRHNTAMSVLGVFYEITKAKSVKQIESVVAVTQKVLPLAETLQAFRV